MLFTEYNFFKLSFVNPASPLMYGIIELHDHIFFFLNMVLFLVLFLLWTTLRFFSHGVNTRLNKYLLLQATKDKFDWLRLSHGTKIEIIWTVLPSVILILIAIPSFALLYATDELVDPSVTVQVIGHQWYRSYEYNDLTVRNPVLLQATTNTLFTKSEKPVSVIFNDFLRNELSPMAYESLSRKLIEMKYKTTTSGCITCKTVVPSKLPIMVYLPWLKAVLAMKVYATPLYTGGSTITGGNLEFDSYMRQEADLLQGERRLYETDFPLVLPKFTHIRSMITADDVIHSWSVPALGIKVDAVPGRINHAHTYIKRSGIFYGQCSELRGVNHAFTPIQILVFEPSMYYNYLQLMLLNK